MALTQQQVDDAPARDTFVSDGKGLLLRTTSKGAKAWYWQKTVNGKRTRQRIGDARGMSLYEARQIVRGNSAHARERVRMLEDRVVCLEATNEELRAHVARLEAANMSLVGAHNGMLDLVRQVGLRPERQSIDMREVTALRKAGVSHERTLRAFAADATVKHADTPTFAHYADKWIERNRRVWSAGSLKQYRSKLRNHVLPKLGDKPVGGLSARMLADVANATTNGTRAHVLVCIRGAMDIALAEDACDDVAGRRLDALIVRENANVKHRDALPVQDAPAFYKSLGDSAPEQALKLLMLTATRINAVSNGDASELHDDVWIVPDSRQSKSKRTPRVPLTAQALRNVDGLGVSATEVRKLVAGKPFTLHGMRSTFRSWAQQQAAYSFEAKEIALGHTVGTKVQRAYQRDDLLAERRELMRAWARYLTGDA